LGLLTTDGLLSVKLATTVLAGKGTLGVVRKVVPDAAIGVDRSAVLVAIPVWPLGSMDGHGQ